VQGRGGCEGAERPAAGGAAQQGRPALLLPVRGACAGSRQRLLLGAAALGAAPAGHRLLGAAAAAAGQLRSASSNAVRADGNDTRDQRKKR